MKAKNILYALPLVVLGWGLFILGGEEVLAANPATRPYLQVITSADKITDQQVVTVTALAATYEGQPVDRFQMKIGSTSYKCLSTYFCQQTVGPFSVTKPTWVGYEITAIDVQGKNNESRRTATGRFLVTPTKKDTQKPVFTKITTSNHQLSPGESFALEITTKDNKGIAKIDILLDGNLLKTCANEKVCGTTAGPFTTEDVGEHAYTFIVTDTDGNYIKPWGKFWVRSSTQPAAARGVDNEAPQVRVTGQLRLSQTREGGQGYEIKANATDNSGRIARTEIYITEVGQPMGNPVFTCGAKPSPSGCLESGNADLMFNKRYAYQAYAYDEAGNRGMSMMYYFDIPSFDETLPQVILIPSKDNLQLGDKVTLTARATDNYGVNRIEIRKFGLDTVKQCDGINNGVSTCSYTDGPLTVGEHKYDATAYDAAGNQAWSGWVVLRVGSNNTNPTPTTPVGNDTEAPVVSVEAEPNSSNSPEGHGYVYTIRATDNSGAVANMEFFIAAEGQEFSQTPTMTCGRAQNPHSCGNIGYLPGGRNYYYQAKAYDDAGNIGYSPRSFFWMPN